MRAFPEQVTPAKFPPDPVNPEAWTSSNANDTLNEIKGSITDSGQTLIPVDDPADDTQLSRSISILTGRADFFSDTGAANAYVLAAVGDIKAPIAYGPGMQIRWFANAANTGASTVDVAGIGAVDLVRQGGAALTGGEVSTALINIADYKSLTGSFEIRPNVQFLSPVPGALITYEFNPSGSGNVIPAVPSDRNVDFNTVEIDDIGITTNFPDGIILPVGRFYVQSLVNVRSDGSDIAASVQARIESPNNTQIGAAGGAVAGPDLSVPAGDNGGSSVIFMDGVVTSGGSQDLRVMIRVGQSNDAYTRWLGANTSGWTTSMQQIKVWRY